MGVDLFYVFCVSVVVFVIKVYSLELIVYLVFDSFNVVYEVEKWLFWLYVFVVGFGLGRDDVFFRNV